MPNQQNTEQTPLRKRGPKPGTAAAKRGGIAAREKYGVEHFRQIGKKGGTTVKERHGSEYYSRIGHQGGEQTKARHGSEYFSRIGRIGGLKRHKEDLSSEA
jgi:hypothetical protein